MVKIYIKNINIDTINDHMDAFKKNFKSKHSFLKLYSEEEYGIYIIENDNVYFMEPIFEDHIEEINYGKFNFLIDYSNDIKVPVISQIPLNYIYSSITRYEYKFNNLKLIIDGIYDKKKTNINYKKKTLLDDFTKVFIPVDFYLEYTEKGINSKHLDLNNPFFKEELNGLLMHLI